MGHGIERRHLSREEAGVGRGGIALLYWSEFEKESW